MLGFMSWANENVSYLLYQLLMNNLFYFPLMFHIMEV